MAVDKIKRYLITRERGCVIDFIIICVTMIYLFIRSGETMNKELRNIIEEVEDSDYNFIVTLVEKYVKYNNIK